MPCETTSVGHFFVVRWGRATPADCQRIINEVTALGKAQGKPPLYLGIMPADMPRLDPEARDALMTLTRQLAENTVFTCVAMEARGFAGAALRGMMAGIVLMGGMRQRIKFVDSVETALAHMKSHLLEDRKQMRAAIEQVGGAVPDNFV